MSTSTSRKPRVPVFYPLLLALFPLLSLYAETCRDVDARIIVQPMLILLVATGALIAVAFPKLQRCSPPWHPAC
jgi:hypothetical protein